MRHFPSHIPSKMGYGVNATTVFERDNLDSVLKRWDRRTLYFEGMPKLSLAGQITRPRRGTTHQFCSEISVYAFEEEPSAVRSFVYEISNAFEAFYAAAHILTKEQLRWNARQRQRATNPELATRREKALQRRLGLWPKREVLGPEIQAVNTRRGYIYDLYWLNVFGPEYVQFFGRPRILSIPAHRVDELTYGGIGVQLTPVIEDTKGAESWERFLDSRANGKVHLDNNSFFDRNLPADHVYSGPALGPTIRLGN